MRTNKNKNVDCTSCLKGWYCIDHRLSVILKQRIEFSKKEDALEAGTKCNATVYKREDGIYIVWPKTLKPLQLESITR